MEKKDKREIKREEKKKRDRERIVTCVIAVTDNVSIQPK